MNTNPQPRLLGFHAFSLSLDIIRLVREPLELIRRHDTDLAKQLRRAASSVSLNLAESRGRRGADPASPRLEPRPIQQLLEEEDPEDILFGPREFMDMAQIDAFELNGQVSYGRYYMCVPLIDYSRGVFRDARMLGASNLVFESLRSRPHEDDWTPQPPEFIAWGKRVLSWVRRDAPRVVVHKVGHKRMTEKVFAELASGLDLAY